jgi:hypothetical protein
MTSLLYHEGNRRTQDQFDSRRIADRLEQVTLRRQFTDEDRAFIEGVELFFLATADAGGRPDCSLSRWARARGASPSTEPQPSPGQTGTSEA